MSSSRNCTAIVFAFIALLGCLSPTLFAETKTQETAVEKDRFQSIADRIDMVIAADGSGKTLHRQPQPALSWSNPERKTLSGGMYFWTLKGRVKAAVCLYPDEDGSTVLEFQSLTDQSMRVSLADNLLWHPTESGIQWTPLIQAAPPRRTPFARLRQMRKLAREFSGKLVPPTKSSIPLRLLETPLYRYEPQSGEVGERVFDGAIFALVQGTDPEVLLTLEAIDDAGKQAWRYSLARMSMVPTRVEHEKQVIWETKWAIRRINTAYYSTRLELE